MALVESSYYDDDPALSRQVGQYAPPPPVRLQRGGGTRLGIAFAAALIAASTFAFALFWAPAGERGRPAELTLAEANPTPDLLTTDDQPGNPELEERRAARQVALLANVAPPPAPETSVVDLTKTGSVLGTSMEDFKSDETYQIEVAEGVDDVAEKVMAAAENSAAAEMESAEAAYVTLPRSKPAVPQIKEDPVAPAETEDEQKARLAKSEQSFKSADPSATPLRKEPIKLQKSAFAAGGIALNPAPYAAIAEASENGLLPITGPAGETSRDYYKRPFPAGDARPRIAVVIGGLGLSQKATNAAIEMLPPEVTLAFAPYGKDLQGWIDKARAAGHEVLLELPMEPFDYPANDPGPFTLLTKNTQQQNDERLKWLLAQFNGYIGVTNYLGAKFTATPEALMPVLRSLDERGLMVLDDGTSNRSLVAGMSKKLRVPHARAARTIDLRASRNAIDDNLLDLEGIAMRKGAAIGMGFAYPVTIDRIVNWAETLEDKGLVLAPVSANLEETRDTSDPFDSPSY